MATSGSIRTNVTNDGYIYLQLSWSEASQSIEGNYTNINWNLRLISTGHGANIVSSAAKSCTIKFNGTTVFNGTVNIGLSAGQTKTLRSGSNFRINHNSDGKKTFSYSFSQQINITYSGVHIGTKSASGNGTLDTIPRASSISSISGNTIGSSVTVNIDRKASSFTHRVYYSFGNTKNYLLESGVGTSLTFTPAMSDCASVPNAASGTATIRVDTYSGSTKIGTASKNFTLNVPADVKPTIESFTAERIDGTVPSDWGIYVKGKSKAKLTISGAAAGGYGATLKSYSITGGGYTGSTAEYTTGFLNTAGTITFTAKVTDSRGRTASKTVSVTVEDYAPPVIQSASAARCGASGDLQDDGTYVLVTHSLTYSSLGGRTAFPTRTGSGKREKPAGRTPNIRKRMLGILSGRGISARTTAMRLSSRRRTSWKMHPGSCPFPQRRSSWTGKKAAPAWLSARWRRKTVLKWHGLPIWGKSRSHSARVTESYMEPKKTGPYSLYWNRL